MQTVITGILLRKCWLLGCHADPLAPAFKILALNKFADKAFWLYYGPLFAYLIWFNYLKRKLPGNTKVVPRKKILGLDENSSMSTQVWGDWTHSQASPSCRTCPKYLNDARGMSAHARNLMAWVYPHTASRDVWCRGVALHHPCLDEELESGGPTIKKKVMLLCKRTGEGRT